MSLVGPEGSGCEPQDTFGPSPQPTPWHTGGTPVEPGHPEFRAQGPVDEAHHGEIDDPDPAPDDPDGGSGRTWA
jgi:hypothetical protein